MEFKDIVMKRYATKSFDGNTIPDAKINELLELIRYSASSFGLQPYKIMVITDNHTKQRLEKASWNQPQISTCSHLLVFCAYTDISSRIDQYEQLMINRGAKPESIKGYIDMMRGFEKALPDDKKLAWAQKQAYIALGNALNGAKSLGLDSCPMEGFNAEEYTKILNLPKNLIPTVICPIGYANDAPRPKLRYEMKELLV